MTSATALSAPIAGTGRGASLAPRRHGRQDLPPGSTSKAAAYLLKGVIGGNTLELGAGERVHLIGVDTPEKKDPREPVQAFGEEATQFTRRVVEGKRVRAEYDSERQDQSGPQRKGVSPERPRAV